MYSQTDFEIIKNIIIQDVPEAEEIILFGSYAIDKASEDSDIDILVLLTKDYNWIERRDILNRIYRDTAQKGYLVDFILKNKKKFDKDKRLATISKTIATEGRLLWKKA